MSSDPRRARLEALAEWARTLPELAPDEAEARLVEVMGSEEQAGELLRRVDDAQAESDQPA